MKLGFEESQLPYTSGSQSARLGRRLGSGFGPIARTAAMRRYRSFQTIARLPTSSAHLAGRNSNSRARRASSATKVADGAFKTKCERLAASNNPNLLLMNYDLKSLAVVNLFIVPKHFFVRDIIEERNPSRRQRAARAGSGRISCSARYRRSARSISFRTASSVRRTSFLRNGRRRSSSEANRWRRGAGCSTS